mgnify:CR=1 FL=1
MWELATPTVSANNTNNGVVGMATLDASVRRVACHFDISYQLAQFFRLLVVYEFVTTRRVYDELGTAEIRTLAFRLRKAVPDLELNSRRSIGYWLPPGQRTEFAEQFGLEASKPVAVAS